VAEEVYVWGGLVGLLRDYLDHRGFAASELRQTLARYTPTSRLPITVWWRALDTIAALDPAPGTGLRIGRHIQIHHLGVLGYLAAACETLDQALRRFQRFQPLLHNLAPTFVRSHGEALELSWDPAYGRSTQHSDEVLVAALLQLTGALTGGDALRPLLVSFTAPTPEPANVAVYQALLGGPVHFGAHSLVVRLPAQVAARRIDGGDPHLRQLLDQQADALLQALPQPDPFLAELQRQVVGALQLGEPSLIGVARTLGVPERTLYRRLAARGLSYKTLLGELRFQLARRYLADAGLSLTEIALMLGYSEQSAFTRAFRSWSGDTPLHYRKVSVDRA